MATLEPLTVGVPSPKDHPFRQPGDLSGRCAVPDCGGYLVEHLAPLRSTQPAPTGNGPEVLPVVLKFLTDRQEHGRRKYGTVLRAHNGRDALQDAVEEAGDQLMYLTQLRMQWPALVAKVRHDALTEVLQLVEVAFQAEEGPDTELGRAAAAVNGALRQLHDAIRGLQGQPPAEPSPARTSMRKPHRWAVAGPKRWRCRDCPCEQHHEPGPRGGMVRVFTVGGQELSRGTPAVVRVPLCPPAPSKGES